jgi:hypothetical protein
VEEDCYLPCEGVLVHHRDVSKVGIKNDSGLLCLSDNLTKFLFPTVYRSRLGRGIIRARIPGT